VHAQKVFIDGVHDERLGDHWLRGQVGIIKANPCYSSHLEEAHREGFLSV